MTQPEIILEHLQNNIEGITSREADRKYGVSRLSAIVLVLKKEGYDIQSKLIKVKNRYGKSVYVSRYFLEDK